MNRVARLSLLVMTFIFPLGCDNANGLPDVSHRVVSVEDTDEVMNEAISNAKETLPVFEQHWKRSEVESCNIKLALKTNTDQLEHIWFTPIQIIGDKVTAKCANDPENIPDLKFGDIRTVDRSAISDWMIIESGKCYGGYTIRVLSKRDPKNAPPLEFADYSMAVK